MLQYEQVWCSLVPTHAERYDSHVAHTGLASGIAPHLYVAMDNFTNTLPHMSPLP